MSAFNLYFLHVEFVGCFGQEHSYGTEHMLFYYWAIKYLAFQYNNSVLAAWGNILVAAFGWLALQYACVAGWEASWDAVRVFWG